MKIKGVILCVVSVFPAILIVATTILIMYMNQETKEQEQTVTLKIEVQPQVQEAVEEKALGQILIHNAPLYEETPGETVLEVLEKGEVVTIIEKNAEYWKVGYREKEGYIRADFVMDVDGFDAELLKNVKLIVIDAGHQAKGDNQTEPIGPGSTEPHARVTSGTTGVRSNMPESELTLKIALQLENELKKRGYVVIQVRTTQDVNISNKERSEIANQHKADAFIRIHANGSENSAVNGAQTICPAENNEFPIGRLYQECHLLSECVLDAYIEETGFQREYISERNNLAGINWCEVPVTLVELGYMSNPDEDIRMQDVLYQEKMVSGIANGIDKYFEKMEENSNESETYSFLGFKRNTGCYNCYGDSNLYAKA